MARSLAVKVPTASLIKMIEDKIATIKQDVANYPAAIKQYELDKETYKKSIATLTIKALTENPTLVGDSYDSVIRVSVGYNGNVEVSLDRNALGFPDSPEKPQDPNSRTWYGREHATPLEMLEKTLKVLKLTNQEEVNASTYGSVMELL